MVFPSPLYLDPPNWQQHPNNQQVLQGGGSGGNHHDQNNHLIPPAPLPQPSGSSRMTQMGMGGGAGGGLGGPASRPNSMAEMARRAKISPPETLPCPRCESTNTKFCYFNNYSLQQPRHFCKTCRRYWTNGGALRNVPVGGGCRRNKRSSSKSTSGGSGGGGGGSSSKSSLTSPSTLVGGDRISLHMDLATTSGLGPIFPVLPSGGGSTGMSSFMASLQNIAMGNLGLSFGGGLSPPPPHPLGGLGGLNATTHGGGGVGGNHHLDFPQLNPISTNPQVQFPNFLAGFELPTDSSNTPDGSRLYSSTLQNDQGIIDGDQNNNQEGNNSLPKNCSSEMDSQFASIKTENDAQGLNLHKQFMNMASNSATSNQFWGGNIENNNTNEGTTTMWNDLSGHNSSSTSHLL